MLVLKPHFLPRISRVATPSSSSSSLFLLRRALPPFVLKAAMSTTTQVPKYDWMCLIPYKLDAAERRLACRPLHMEGIKTLTEAKFITLGGPYYDEIPAAGEEVTFRGTTLACVAESKEAVIAVLKKDPYSVNNVWDWEKAQIFPFQCLVRTALEK